MKIIYIFLGILITLLFMKTKNQRNIRTEQPKEIVKVKYVPMNIPTQRMDTFTKIGHLFSGTNIMPLYGRQIHTGSHMWNYYTVSDGSIPVKLSFINDKRSCDDEYGCRELNDDDTVHIQEYGKNFRVSLDQRGIRYNPHFY